MQFEYVLVCIFVRVIKFISMLHCAVVKTNLKALTAHVRMHDVIGINLTYSCLDGIKVFVYYSVTPISRASQFWLMRHSLLLTAVLPDSYP